MSELANADRAGWARKALNEYVDETRSMCATDYEFTPDNKDNNEEVIGDFLSDLHHLCDELGIDWEGVLASGAMHHREEVAEERQAAAVAHSACAVCSEPIHRALISKVWIHRHGSPSCGTGDGATAMPPASSTVDEILELIKPDPWGQGQAEAADARKRNAFDVAAGDRTLSPVDQSTRAALHPMEGDERVLVRLEIPELTYSDEWTEATDLRTGHTIAVRRADCGAGCKCAAEVKLIPMEEGK